MNDPQEKQTWVSAKLKIASEAIERNVGNFDLKKIQYLGVHKGLDATLERIRNDYSLSLSTSDRLIVFSDHHRGAGDENDDFKKSRQTYLQALRFYLAKDYTLVLLGDAEDCWEDDPARILETHREVYEVEARFYQNNRRYVRVFGNHDRIWEQRDMVAKYLHPMFPGLVVHEGIALTFSNGCTNPGLLVMVHGHQGTLDSDTLRSISAPVVRALWKPVQKLTNVTGTKVSKNYSLQERHDTEIYLWAAKQPALAILAGHTHRPVWCSRTELDKRMGELQQLLEQPLPEDPESRRVHRQEIDDKVSRINYLTLDGRSGSGSIKTIPCYFNTGCCSLPDGDITGIEIANGEIALVRWSSDDDTAASPETRYLERTALASIFETLECFEKLISPDGR